MNVMVSVGQVYGCGLGLEAHLVEGEQVVEDVHGGGEGQRHVLRDVQAVLVLRGEMGEGEAQGERWGSDCG